MKLRTTTYLRDTSCSEGRKRLHTRLNLSANRLQGDAHRYLRLRSRPLDLWRRGGDSNPRHPFGVKLLSRQPCSATPAPLRGDVGRIRDAACELVRKIV